MRTLWQDLRYGARMLLKNPGFSLIAVLTLALGIGANTAIFSVINAVLLRPLAYPEPERIMTLSPDFSGSNFQGVSETKFVFWRANSQSFDGMTATQGVGSGINLSGGNEPEFVSGLRVSVDFFRVLGVNPIVGRGFTAEEDSPDGERVVILSHGLWRQRFNADPAISGKTVSLNSNSYTVVGVLPEGFRYLPEGLRYSDRVDVLLPMQINSASREEGHNFNVLGRLKPGITEQQAQAEMRLVYEKFKSAEPKMLWRREQGIRVELYLATMTAEIRSLLLILFGAVAFVLLIACANVANLQLTRAAARQKEMAIRAAMGASGWRITRQLMTEGVLLALLGCGAGLILTVWGVEALVAMAPPGLIPRTEEIGFDWHVLVFALATAVVTGVIFALAPASKTWRLNLNDMLKDGAGKGSASGERRRLQSVLVVAEVALALVLLIGATLLLRTFANLRKVEPGFDPHNVLTLEISPKGAQFDTTEKQSDYFRRALERIKVLPGVESAAVTSNLPLGAWLNLGVGTAGKPDSMSSTEIRTITPDYFNVMRMAVHRGRAFSEADTAGSAPAIVVNEAYARRAFPNADPLGQSLTIEGLKVYQVVGVVNDLKQFDLRTSSPPTVFVPIPQVPDKIMQAAREFVTMKFAIRTQSDPLSLGAAVRRELLNVDASLPIANMRSLEQIVSRSLASDRFNTLLVGLFALIGMVLATVGIYGVISYTVANGTREIGLRMALGAQKPDVLKLVIGRGIWLTVLGVVLGLAGAFALTRVMKKFLFDVSTTDPSSFAGISLLLILVALLACWIPARRATKVDPMVALRYE